MKISFWQALSGLLIMSNIFLIYQKFNSNKKINELNLYNQEITEDCKSQKEVAEWYSLIPYYANGQLLDGRTKLLTINSESINIDEIYSRRGVWILRFFNKTCLSCVEENIGVIQEYFSHNPRIPFVVITDFNNANEMRIFKSKTHFQSDIYTSDSFLEFSPEDSSIPYLTFINNEGFVSDCFIIQKEQTDILKNFLLIISSRYE